MRMSKQKLLKEIKDNLSEGSLFDVSINGATPYSMEEKHLEFLLSFIRERKGREMVSGEPSPQENPAEIKIPGLLVGSLSASEALFLKENFAGAKKSPESRGIDASEWEIEGDFVFLVFPYNFLTIEKVRALSSSKWFPEKKSWRIHISEWPKIRGLFHAKQPRVEEMSLKWEASLATNKLVIKNEGCRLTGRDLPFLDIHLATSFPDPNAAHTPSFRNGTWDGRVALFDRPSGLFPFGLFKRVKDVLDEAKVCYDFVDERVRPEKRHSFSKNVSLRDYQERTVKAALDSGRGILQLATGAGKTKIASAITSEYGLNTVFFVHTKFLLNQAKKELEKVLSAEIGQVGDGIVDIRSVTVAMIQTTIKALGEKYTPSIDEEESGESEDNTNIEGKEQAIIGMLDRSEIIFFDECQFVAADSFYTIANRCPAYYKFGLSATPYRSDKKDLMIEAALGPIIDKVDASFLIKKGYLTQPKIHFFRVGTNIHKDGRKYPEIYKSEIVESAHRNRLVINSAMKLRSKNKSVLILVQQVSHGKILQELFKKEDLNVSFVFGEDNSSKRENEVFKLKTKKSLILIASTIADEGLDIPSLDAVILAGGGKSPCKSLQRVGRALRVFREKERLEEVYNTLIELREKNASCLVLVEDPTHVYGVSKFLAWERDGCSTLKIETLKKEEATLLQPNLFKENPIVVSARCNISDEQLQAVKGLDAILLLPSGSFEGVGLPNTPLNVSILKEWGNVSPEIFKGAATHSLILVEDTKTGKQVKDSLKAEGVDCKLLLGDKCGELESLLEANTPGKILTFIVNASSVEKLPDTSSLDKVYAVGKGSLPHRALEMLQRDVRVFSVKKEAIVVDFFDQAKYVSKHSFERHKMFKTEEDFIITSSPE